jgi:separase
MSAGHEIEIIKTAISSFQANTHTVTCLQRLLSLAQTPSTPDNAEKAKQAVRPGQASRNRKTNGADHQDSQISGASEKSRARQYEPADIPQKTRFALATDIVNLSLRVLTDCSRKREAQNNLCPRASSPLGSKRAVSPNQHIIERATTKNIALKSEAQNPSSTKVAADSGSKRNGTGQQRSPNTYDESDGYVVCTAEIARLGFLYLRLVDTKKHGLREPQRLQLESGMLALVARLVALNLDSLAIKELVAVKKMLEGDATISKPGKIGASKQKSVTRESAATLLDLQVDLEGQPDLVTPLLNYQTYVLRLMSRQSDTGSINVAICNLRTESNVSPLKVILRYARIPSNREKAIRHLETLATVLSGLASALSHSADSVACDPKSSLSPIIAFELHCLALETQLELWKLAGHEIDVEREVLQPYYRCLATALRRATKMSSVSDLLELSMSFYKKIQIVASKQLDSSNTATGFAIHKTLSTLAERASRKREAIMWTTKAEQNSQAAESSARRMSILVQRALRALATDANDGTILNLLEAARSAFKQAVSGTSQDYELLLSDLAEFVQGRAVPDKEIFRAVSHDICVEAAAFATRFSRTYPDRDTKNSLVIIDAAIAGSDSSQAMIKWVGKDTFGIFKRAGVLRDVSQHAAANSMLAAWSSSRVATTFGRMIKALIIRVHKQSLPRDSLLEWDEEITDLSEKGILLEWQLKCVVELARKTRYDQASKEMAAEILSKLAHTYSSTAFPLRRARVGLVAMQMKQECSEVLLSKAGHSTWAECSIDIDHMGLDSGLVAYVANTMAMSAVFRLFGQGQPSMEQIRPQIEIWRGLLGTCSGSRSVADVVEDPNLLANQISGLTEYFMALGEASSALTVALLLVNFSQAAKFSKVAQLSNLISLARACLACQLVELAETTLAEALAILRTTEDTDTIRTEIMQLRLCQASCSLMANEIAKSQSFLDMGEQLHLEQRSGTSQSRSNRLLHGQAWLIHSQLAQALGDHSSALCMAKRAVKVLNIVWSLLDKKGKKQEVASVEESDVDTVAAKIRKLNLGSTKDKSASSSNDAHLRAAMKWPVIPSLCAALLHLSTIYRQHGIFQEAKFYSDQALKVAEAIGPCELLARVRYHRIGLFIVGGLIEDAELSLAVGNQEWHSPSLIRVEQLQAKAGVAAKNGSIEESIEFLDEADRELTVLATAVPVIEFQRYADGADQSATGAEKAPIPSLKSARNTKDSKSRPAAQRARSKQAAASTTAKKEDVQVIPVALQKLKSRIRLAKQSLEAHTDCSAVDMMISTNVAGDRAAETETQHLKMRTAISETTAAVAKDTSSVVLQESTLAMPAIMAGELHQSSDTKRPARKADIRLAGRKAQAVSEHSNPSGLQSVWDHFASKNALVASDNTATAHFEASMLCQLSMLMTITSHSLPEPQLVACAIEYARMNASRKYASIAYSDREHAEPQSLHAWPDKNMLSPTQHQTPVDFQQCYVDILPATWTAVSMSLNAESDELCLTRYRCSQPPLVVRLPFARHKPDSEEDEPFDFHMGKEELKEIIELSNYSCHNAGDTSAKGAKSKWWTEREALDRRLQELLINIENLWLGGFKGILLESRPYPEALIRFRKAFDAVLNRHLPSRQVQKRGSARLSLDDQILELFVNLGTDEQEGLDEALSDLMYFVVDMLQLKGENNAYDEIDFDAAVVEITDALQAYHDSVADEDSSRGHIILVLDRRLHVFPWENIPFLEGVSVSRVDSMITLHDRIIDMRAQQRFAEESMYTISRESGCYILNPSKDLTATEKTLGPSLHKLQTAENKWISIVGRPPSEEDFVSALANSAITLYFGHGAGAQYIRTRAVRRLERCSEVVWLMGCSSGAATEYDSLEPFLVPLAYLVAGQRSEDTSSTSAPEQATSVQIPAGGRTKCMAVVATLWDVTDKDIDRFSLAIGEEWGLWSDTQEATALPAKTPKKREAVAVYSTPQRQPKTPKSPKVRPTPAETRTPARSRSRPRDRNKSKQSLVDAVARSRDVCYLRYLNGAAPVVYGLPVYLDD